MGKLYVCTNDQPVQMICKNDPIMKKLITIIGDIEITLREDYLSSIVRSIVGQLISVPAASAIYNRLIGLLGGNITAAGLLGKSKEELRHVGLTMRKTEYIKDLADKVMNGDLDLENIATYTDEEVMNQLMRVKGIGKWTAEVFLILSLGRKDVLAVDDVGIQRAAKWLYRVEKSERRNILIEKSSLWKPYRSIVSFYLWEAIHLGFVTDFACVEHIKNHK